MVDVISEVYAYDASGYYGNGALTDLPLWNVDDDGILKPDDFVSFEDVYVVPQEDWIRDELNSLALDTTKLDVAFEATIDLVLTPVDGASDGDNSAIPTWGTDVK